VKKALITGVAGYYGEVICDSRRPDGRMVRFLDVERARQVIGLEARVGLRDGIVEMVEWFRSPAG
jgi:nucleoside-diphosphate-sugar epimerase